MLCNKVNNRLNDIGRVECQSRIGDPRQEKYWWFHNLAQDEEAKDAVSNQFRVDELMLWKSKHARTADILVYVHYYSDQQHAFMISFHKE